MDVVDGWMEKWTDWRRSGWMGEEWMDTRRNGCMGGEVDGWVEELMDG